MSNNKIDFINDLLSSKKIKIEEKNKILELTKSELMNFDSENEELVVRIEKIEKHLHISKQPLLEQVIESLALADLYIDPINLRDFLINYNQDPILKYTCHELDNPDSFQNILEECKIKTYDFERHLSLIQKKFNRLSFEYKEKILQNVIGLISSYLGTYNPEKGWSVNQIKIGWSSPELKEWASDNPNKIPNPSNDFQNERFRFKTINLKNGSAISDFTLLVSHFKNLFHFKETNLLRNHIGDYIFLNYSDKNKYQIEYDRNFSDSIELFTYSETLLQAIGKILDASKKYHVNELLKVKLHFNYDNKNQKELRIVILNSKKFGKHFNALESRMGDDFTNLINKQINGLCNLYLKAFFTDKKAVGIVNMWDGKKLEFKKASDNIEGVEFILKMY